jgi:RimJ/RimL family protein N-acetyltransferase
MRATVLTVRRLAREHAALLLPHLSDPAIYEYIPGRPAPDRATLEFEFARLCAGCPRADELWLNWVAFRDDQPVATLQATVFADRTANIGYVVFPSVWGQGVGGAGVRWIIRELYTEHQVRAVHAFVDPRNTRSLRLLASVGFREQRELERPAAASETDRTFELTLDDWLKLSR